MAGGFDLGPTWVWMAGCAFALIGFVACIIGLVYLAVWIAKHVQFV